ncbi:MAG: glycosyltransferase family 4 protein [Proteobacteria bacterium]|nr:glycosyltransferase family 4 protein [Pseudomonadota bacterium]
MKIAFVHNQCLPYRHFLFSYLSDHFDIEFFLLNQSKDEIPSNIKAQLIKAYKIPKASDYWWAPTLHRRLQSKRFDLIIGNDLGGYNTAVAFKFAQKNKLPFVPWIEEWTWINHPRRKRRLDFENELLNYSKYVVSPGIKHMEYLEERGVDTSKIWQVPNCLEEKIKRYSKDHWLFKRLTETISNRTCICSIGRHVPFKGHEQLIRAYDIVEKRLQNEAPVLIIAGNGPLLDHHKKIAESLKLQNIHFIEKFIDDEEKNILLDLCDIFVLASTRTRAFEAWGLVCNEALYFQKPIIASSTVGCAREVVRDDINGYIFKDTDINELADKIMRMATDPHLISDFSKRSREVYKDYHPDVMKSKFHRLLTVFQK